VPISPLEGFDIAVELALGVFKGTCAFVDATVAPGAFVDAAQLAQRYGADPVTSRRTGVLPQAATPLRHRASIASMM
jgi:hypothetical protein